MVGLLLVGPTAAVDDPHLELVVVVPGAAHELEVRVPLVLGLLDETNLEGGGRKGRRVLEIRQW